MSVTHRPPRIKKYILPSARDLVPNWSGNVVPLAKTKLKTADGRKSEKTYEKLIY